MPACVTMSLSCLGVNTKSRKVMAKMWKCHHDPQALWGPGWSGMSKLSHVALSPGHGLPAPVLLWCQAGRLKPMQQAYSRVWGEGDW